MLVENRGVGWVLLIFFFNLFLFGLMVFYYIDLFKVFDYL